MRLTDYEREKRQSVRRNARKNRLYAKQMAEAKALYDAVIDKSSAQLNAGRKGDRLSGAARQRIAQSKLSRQRFGSKPPQALV